MSRFTDALKGTVTLTPAEERMVVPIRELTVETGNMFALKKVIEQCQDECRKANAHDHDR